MSVGIARGKADKVIKKVMGALEPYAAANPAAQVDVYRQNVVSIRIRIVDPSFHRLEKSQRHTKVWKFLEKLPEDVQSDISMLLLLTPDEKATSIGNLEFDDPVPSTIQ